MRENCLGRDFPWNEMETVELSMGVCTDGSDAHC